MTWRNDHASVERQLNSRFKRLLVLIKRRLKIRALNRKSELQSTLAGVFYRDLNGVYLDAPLEKLAALILHRVAQAQAFENGNKRTALLACYFFLFNNGYTLRIDRGEISDLIWGFAREESEGPRYGVAEALRYIENNLTPRR